MRYFTIISYAFRVLAMVITMLVTTGCETMQPVVDADTTTGVTSGPLTERQAQSLKRSSVTVTRTFRDVTPEQEYYIGRAVAAMVMKQYRPYNNTEANYYLNLVGQTLAQYSDRPETFGGYHFLILDSEEINALGAPGGLILVTRGMLRCCKTEDALAAVLAHEIGHVQGQHGLRAIKPGRLTPALNLLAVEGSSDFGGTELNKLSEAFDGSISDITSTLMNNGYSRELERDADHSAVKILEQVGYNPHALIVMLTQMKKQLLPGGSDFAKTHPAPEERISDVRGVIGSIPVTGIPPARQQRFAHALGDA